MDIQLSDHEARILGVLIEKHLSTPDHYPLSINALTNGCNQKSNRNPVVTYRESEVQETVDVLHRKHLVGRSMGTGSRTTKYRHSLGETWRLQRPELAVLSTLLLRGPQTIGEIRTRTQRMFAFDSIEIASEAIESLVGREESLVTHLPRRPGQKEGRCAHLLCGVPVTDQDDEHSEIADGGPPSPIPKADGEGGTSHPSGPRNPAGSQRAAGDELAELRARIDALESAFASFKKQFE